MLFPEGPVVRNDGTLLVAEMAAGSITEVDTSSGATTPYAQCGGAPNGLAVGPDGALYVCNGGATSWAEVRGILRPQGSASDYAGGSIQRVDPSTREVTTLFTHCGRSRLSAPNDLVFDRAGGFWFTDTGKSHASSRDHGALYYATADGSSISVEVTGLITPNGVALSPDQQELYVAETVTARVWAWPVSSSGVLGRAGDGPRGARLVCGLGGYRMFDSMAVDAEGKLCVATLIDGSISVLSSLGALVRSVDVAANDPLVTNLCFGGPESRTAYITASGRGRIYEMNWHCAGLALSH